MAILIRVRNIPKSTRILVGSLLTISFFVFVAKVKQYHNLVVENGEEVSFYNMKIPYLQLIPRTTIFYPWVIVTAIFAEITILSFILSGVILIFSSKYIEKFWGWKEVVRFILVIGSATNFVSVLITIVCNILRDDIKGMDQPLGGGISYYFGFLVVLKQLIPEHNILLFQGLLNLRIKQVPFILLIIVLLWSLLITGSLYPAIPSLSSFMFSYLYLRFYQTFSDDLVLPITNIAGESSSIVFTRGDASDTFAFVEIFPAFSKPYLGPLFDKVYEIGVLLGIITPFNDESIEQSNLRAQKRQDQVNQAQKNVANSVAERRRQVALQVIEDRINKENKTRA